MLVSKFGTELLYDKNLSYQYDIWVLFLLFNRFHHLTETWRWTPLRGQSVHFENLNLNKDAPSVLLLFFHFIWLFRQYFNMFKDLCLKSRTYRHKIVRLSCAQFGAVSALPGVFHQAVWLAVGVSELIKMKHIHPIVCLKLPNHLAEMICNYFFWIF